MKGILQAITDRVTTKKGMWITLALWLIVTVVLAFFAPMASDYKVMNIESLPEDAKSVIAQNKIDEYFKDNEGIPAILVFQAKEGEIELAELTKIVEKIDSEKVAGVEQIVPIGKMPPQAATNFFSEDKTTAMIPLIYDASMESTDLQSSNEELSKIVEDSDLEMYITGPAGIAADALEMFSRADVVLIMATVGIILILLIVIYRSPLLALIPLLAASFVYMVANQILGIMGKYGVEIGNETLSIMSILLFATVIDYSLFVFSRYREELKAYENKYMAIKMAMRGAGMPVFFSGGTVLAAMLVLLFAQFGEYRNFAPTFGTTMAIVMLASITLVPALFTLFGRRAFWPKIPRVGDEKVKSGSLWSKVGRFVSKKPVLSIVFVGIFLLASASNMLNLTYEFDTMKSFPEDMKSRIGYEILEDKFEKGDLAPTTVLYEGKTALTAEEQESLRAELEKQDFVSSVRVNGAAEEGKVISFSVTLDENPYAIEAIDAVENMINGADKIVQDSGVEGTLYFAGETATQVDDRNVNNRDVVVIVLLETILIFALLIVLTKSIKMPIYMMGTILVSYLAALGLGMFLTNLFFDINTIGDRVPLYAFVFLVALGIDYNIMLVSRFLEEREKHPVRKAVEIAVANTGGVISSAGIILAATFAVLMTQPVQLLFVFGFIVAVGILIDTFLVRGVLLPGLIVLLEKDRVKVGSDGK